MGPLVVDRSAVEAEAARRRVIRDTGYRRWFLGKFVMSAVAFYALAFLLRYTNGPRQPFATMPAWNLAVMFTLPALLAVTITYLAARMNFSPEACDPNRLMDRVSKDVASLTGPGWIVRILLAALGLAVGIALPLGVFAYLRMPIVPPFVSRPLGPWQTFIGLVVWALAMAFVIRYAALYTYRGMLRQPVAGPAPAR